MGEIGISFRCTLCKSSFSAPCQILNAYIRLWEPDPALATHRLGAFPVAPEERGSPRASSRSPPADADSSTRKQRPGGTGMDQARCAYDRPLSRGIAYSINAREYRCSNFRTLRDQLLLSLSRICAHRIAPASRAMRKLSYIRARLPDIFPADDPLGVRIPRAMAW